MPSSPSVPVAKPLCVLSPTSSHRCEVLQPFRAAAAFCRDSAHFQLRTVAVRHATPCLNCEVLPPLHGLKQILFVEVTLLVCSAVFGTEIWPAAKYWTMYTIWQRIGPLLMKMQKRYGKTDSFSELTEKEIIRAERNSGVVSNKVREIQLQNASRMKEQKARRENDLRQGLRLYKNAKYEEALEKFKSVLGSKPTSDEASVASYNVACCYSQCRNFLTINFFASNFSFVLL